MRAEFGGGVFKSTVPSPWCQVQKAPDIKASGGKVVSVGTELLGGSQSTTHWDDWRGSGASPRERGCHSVIMHLETWI